MADDEHGEVENVGKWIDRLEAFASSLDDIEGESATDFADNALEAWQHLTLSSVTGVNPSALVIFEALNALAKTSTTMIMDWADTPDVRDRYTRDSAQRLMEDALRDVLSERKGWLTGGLPSSDEIQQRFAAVAADLKESLDVLGRRTAEMDAEDTEAAADPYGAILLHRDPSRSDAPIFERLCSFTNEENTRYRDAYERLRRMIDSELLQHISDESDRLCDVLVGVLGELQSQRVTLSDQDAMDERRRRIRSALISFTAALQIHEYQTIRSARRTLSLDRSQVEEVKTLFDGLKKMSFEYRWLEALRDALQHGDIDAFKWSFNASVCDNPEVKINMDRAFMLEFINDNRNKPWLKRRELEELDSDPSVLDMIKAIQPLMGPLQEKLDNVMYPNVAEDAATVRELIGRFQGRRGMYLLQTGPGFTRRQLAPSQTPLAPRVLHFADTYGASAV
ncbi:hypothetical protein [Candidatus Mycolicibacterium alkanivorans]|uniref:Uncharacterized protein n=1 Tax=Candidatus Mycolicibacterium alkanivorans TaxID=2954114 RepID=A0ABS9YWK7_9MYCO|nr:hypothetical protein [Candidatus Mycolicibacterium alkanivorans]MCI4675613.1 hypothetical protein [Candidatus Mycolicibacterium alkanivorans]